MNFIKTQTSLLFPTSFLFLLVFACQTPTPEHSQQQTPPPVTEPVAETVHPLVGSWSINKERTLVYILEQQGKDFHALKASIRKRLLQNLSISIHVTFLADGNWRANFRKGTEQKKGQGTYEILEEADNRLAVRTVEHSELGTEIQVHDIEFLPDSPPIRILMSFSEGEKSSAFVLERQ